MKPWLTALVRLYRAKAYDSLPQLAAEDTVHLAAERLDERQRALALQQRADERWRAFTAESTVTEIATEPLSEEDLVKLSGAFRADA